MNRSLHVNNFVNIVVAVVVIVEVLMINKISINSTQFNSTHGVGYRLSVSVGAKNKSCL